MMQSAISGAELDREVWRHKMKDLCEATGLPRQAIHFYIQKGLLPPGQKTGRNMAFYSDAHVERLRTIKRLQRERFLPLKAIKSLLDGSDEDFTPEQRAFLADVKTRLDGEHAAGRGEAGTLSRSDMLSRTGVDAEDLDRAVELEMVGVVEDEEGERRFAVDDLWLFEGVAALRAAGLTRARGFLIDEFAFYDESMSKLFSHEVKLISGLLSHLPPEEVARMIERVLPVIHKLLVNAHSGKVRDFFATLP